MHARAPGRPRVAHHGSPPTGSGGSGSTSTDTGATATSPPATVTGSCLESANETRGPYPDILGLSGSQAFYRQDIREGRSGLPLSVVFTVVNTRNNCGPVAGAAIEVWQCDGEGHYSEYSQPGYNGTGQTFLRGLQITNSGVPNHAFAMLVDGQTANGVTVAVSVIG